MTFIFIEMTGATVAATALTWRLVAIAKRDGATSLLSMHNMGSTMLHVCLLFTWLLFMRDALSVLLTGASTETMTGFGALFGGFFAMCLAGAKRTASAGPVNTGRG